MNSVRSAFGSALAACCLAAALPALAAGAGPDAQHPDSAFLACARHDDRGARLACLEAALEAATGVAARAPESAPPQPEPGVVPVPAAPPPVPQVAARPTAPAAQPAPAAPAAAAEPVPEQPARTSMLDRLRNFGRAEPARVTAGKDGMEELRDTITALQGGNGNWVITLSSGQVWMQDYPRSMNLRVGDEVRIYQAGFGAGYRLSVTRLGGFIRVQRLQ